MTLTGSEFVRRYLRHVLPSGLRSIRYYGFCDRPPKPSANAFRSIPECHSSSTLGLPRMPLRPTPPWPRSQLATTRCA